MQQEPALRRLLNIGDASPSASRRKCLYVRRFPHFRGGSVLAGNLAFDRRLHLLECTDLDLANTLARNPEFSREVLQRHRFLGEAAGLEDAAFTCIEYTHRASQSLMAMI